jgi:uncharacterized protein (TIGR02301 family)
MNKPIEKLSIILLICGILLASGSNAPVAQSLSSDQKSSESIESEIIRPTLVAPYDEKLMRLSEVLGSIHYLRELCSASEGQFWRTKMVALIDAEQPQLARKQRMIARFNRGYGSFNRTYRTCTQSALLAVNRYMKEGVILASQINSRYGR